MSARAAASSTYNEEYWRNVLLSKERDFLKRSYADQRMAAAKQDVAERRSSRIRTCTVVPSAPRAPSCGSSLSSKGRHYRNEEEDDADFVVSDNDDIEQGSSSSSDELSEDFWDRQPADEHLYREWHQQLYTRNQKKAMKKRQELAERIARLDTQRAFVRPYVAGSSSHVAPPRSVATELPLENEAGNFSEQEEDGQQQQLAQQQEQQQLQQQEEHELLPGPSSAANRKLRPRDKKSRSLWNKTCNWVLGGRKKARGSSSSHDGSKDSKGKGRGKRSAEDMSGSGKNQGRGKRTLIDAPGGPNQFAPRHPVDAELGQSCAAAVRQLRPRDAHGRAAGASGSKSRGNNYAENLMGWGQDQGKGKGRGKRSLCDPPAIFSHLLSPRPGQPTGQGHCSRNPVQRSTHRREESSIRSRSPVQRSAYRREELDEDDRGRSDDNDYDDDDENYDDDAADVAAADANDEERPEPLPGSSSLGSNGVTPKGEPDPMNENKEYCFLKSIQLVINGNSPDQLQGGGDRYNAPLDYMRLLEVNGLWGRNASNSIDPELFNRNCYIAAFNLSTAPNPNDPNNQPTVPCTDSIIVKLDFSEKIPHELQLVVWSQLQSGMIIDHTRAVAVSYYNPFNYK
jgi:hypothetical protein